MRVRKFEELDVWKKSGEFSKGIYSLTGQPTFAKDHALKNQIIRASISISLNIAEVQSALYLALDQRYLTEMKFKELYEDLEILSRMIMSLSKYLSGDRDDSK